MMTKLRCYLRTVLLIAMGLSWFSGAMADLNDGLVAYYPFNGNANDESGNGNDGTVHGATLTEDRFDNANSAYDFKLNSYNNGENPYIGEGEFINDHIVVPTDLLNANFVTISIWFFTTQTITADTFHHDTGYQYHLFNTYNQLHQENRRFFLGIGNFTSAINGEIFGVMGRQGPDYPRSGVRATTVGNIQASWHHFVFHSSSEGHSYFLDGIEYIPDILNSWTSSSKIVPITNTSMAYIGGINAIIDDVRIYNRALSDSEIQQLYQLDNQPPSDDCWATYENGNLHIPCIKVKGPFDDDLHYEADMQYEPLSEPMTFQVTGVKPK